MEKRSADPPVVLFDGVCGLCDRTVRWLLDVDRGRLLRFAPLQGQTAARLLARRPELLQGLDTIVLVEGEDAGQRLLLRSAAVFRILELIGYRSRAVAAARRLPRPLADLGYRLVAATRYGLFGKLPACRVPAPDERERFLP